MSNDPTTKVYGSSNEIYHFEIWFEESEFEDVGGVYIFSKIETSFGGKELIQHVHLYIGQTHSFKERLDSHEKWNDAIEHDVQMILLLRENDKDRRKKIEEDLIEKYNPILNALYCHRKFRPLSNIRLCYNTIYLKGAFRWRNEGNSLL
ncbi:hypothetical protein C6499_07955, partial [Candidatus Poribacteria bacterium]